MTHLTAPLHMVTRFAPSPTGLLHVGHGWSALMAMDLARTSGGAFRLRIEDIDGTRSRPEHVAGIMADLTWLGVDWDGEVVFQSRRLDQYDAALARLRAEGLLYPCFCTRADIQASLTAPHGPEGPVYPGTCRGLSEAERTRRIAAGEAHAWRIDMGRAGARAGALEWTALPFPVQAEPVEGRTVQIAAAALPHGDVVLARKDAPASYHLSCTLDDAAMGVTHVLRGDDLYGATHVHRLIQALLDLPSPTYIHHPLLLGADGKRLAKRDGAIALADLRRDGMDPAALAADLRAGRFPIGISLASA
ncbi:tRNA glutamyl-Q(34) synthetase GluQRS [Sphingobium limneticum]|uniref:tRNA glutamyl-Q(34) synthetase GluQRS n=1 Tax=Sphingobium limneticum TaxID=1007511 RepID=A0A5J5HTS5_9SPHN|nr:tRNA glutamyl-Q(34) synthetase GluQRS [Sphingobium limneticum]KAA9013265.1 tRNA glutamyl-Q(34) synthetase GluQRS [Sphingobium limneticum]KAA9025571.1 tRNA glutamyl-Q(34) synthetase GluQRS [Sphingobium limneticum]